MHKRIRRRPAGLETGVRGSETPKRFITKTYWKYKARQMQCLKVSGHWITSGDNDSVKMVGNNGHLYFSVVCQDTFPTPGPLELWCHPQYKFKCLPSYFLSQLHFHPTWHQVFCHLVNNKKAYMPKVVPSWIMNPILIKLSWKSNKIIRDYSQWCKDSQFWLK